MDNQNRWARLKNKTLEIILDQPQYAYDFLAAPIIAAAVALAADVSPEVGKCAKHMITETIDSPCFFTILLQYLGFIFLAVGGIFMWRLGYYSSVIYRRIWNTEKGLRGEKLNYNPIELEKEITDMTSEIRGEKAGTVFALAGATLFCILWGIFLLFGVGFISGFYMLE